MATLRPFKAFRPLKKFAADVASKPYDVLSSEEAREEVKGKPHSFLHVGKPEVDLDRSIHPYDPAVYAKAKENLDRFIADGILVQDAEPHLYIYAQTMNEHTQYGIVGCASVDEYVNDTIKKHELTRKDKEDDRTNHVHVTNAHTGPIFLTYRAEKKIEQMVDTIVSDTAEYDFFASDGVRHQVWIIDDSTVIQQVTNLFQRIPRLYVADGHHRSASAARVGKERMDMNPNHTGEEEYNFFLAVFFPHDQLRIMDYNRVVKDLNGRTAVQFVDELKKNFDRSLCTIPVTPSKKGEFGMYLEHIWYILETKKDLLSNPDPVEVLDVSILQKNILEPFLGITDPRTDKRIDFVGGIRGLRELEKRVNSEEMKVAFALYPTSIEELMSIADAGKIMPPKSTWFEPKLRDGLFIHSLD